MKVFLQVGANKGQNIPNIRKVYKDDYDIYSFEPNPVCIDILKNNYGNDDKITIMEYAASNKDGISDFYIGAHTLASSLRKDKTSNMTNKKITVETLDLSKWVQEKFTLGDEIILYLDIEGAEYEVLEKLISDNTLKWFNEVYVEFHEEKLKNIDMKRHNELCDILIDAYGDKVYIFNKYQKDLYNRIG